MREVLTVIIVLMIIGVLLDGFRRMRIHRRETLRMSRNVAIQDEVFDDVLEDPVSSEFPGGGPRVVGVRDTTDVVSVNQSLRQSYVASKQTRGSPHRKGDNESKPESGVPMLMDSVDDQGKHRAASSSEREPALGSLDNLDDDYGYDTDDNNDAPLTAPRSSAQTPTPPTYVEDEADLQEEYVPPSAATSERSSAGHTRNPSSDVEPVTARSSGHATENRSASRAAPDEVLVINVMARRGQQFAGPDLLEAMLAEGLRFGDMDIFHRHESPDGHGKVLYSVANMLMPGTFALEAMDEFQSPGISMFLTLPIASDSLSAFNLMAEAAQAIAQRLGGELKDENRSVMTRQTIEHGRQRVLEYDRKRRLAKA